MLARNALSMARARCAMPAAQRAAALSTCTPMQVASANMSPALLMMIQQETPVSRMIIDPFVRNPIIFESSLQITNLPEISTNNMAIECPTDMINEPLLAVKRTYQPSVLRRKRKHGFRSRRLTISGRNLLKRRFLKGRWRMSL